MPKVSIFKNLRKPPVGTIELEVVYNFIKEEYIKKDIDQLRKFLANGQIQEAKKLKALLPAFTPSGVFDGGHNDKDLVEYNHHIVIDIDKVPGEQLASLIQIVSQCEYVKLAFVSPSGAGLKIIAETNGGESTHENSFKILIVFFEKLLSVKCDESGKNVSRLCFFSSDPSAYFNPKSKVFDVTGPQSSNTSSPQKSNTNSPQKSRTELKDDFSGPFMECEQVTKMKFEFADGGRNKFTHFLACNCNRKGIPQDIAQELIMERYGYDFVEQQATIRSAYKNGNEFGTGLFRKQTEAEILQNLISGTNSNGTLSQFGSAPALAGNLQGPATTINQLEKWHYSLADIYNSPPEPRVWGPFVLGSNNAIVASSEAGKSTLLRGLAIAVTTGQPDHLGYQLNAPKKQVIFVSSEDGKGSTAEKFRAMFGSKPPIDVLDRMHFIFDSFNLASRLKFLLEKYPSDFVFIDTWGDAVKGNYQSDETRGKLEVIRNLCRQFGATPVLVHHTNKANENMPDKSSIKGAGDFEQACRCVMMLCKYKGFTWLCLVKANDAGDQEKDTAHELSFDTKTLTLRATGKTESRKKICSDLRREMYGNPQTEIEFEDIVFPEEELAHKELCSRIIGQFGVSQSTAERRIKESVKNGSIKKVGGGYSLPSDRQIPGDDGLTVGKRYRQELVEAGLVDPIS